VLPGSASGESRPGRRPAALLAAQGEDREKAASRSLARAHRATTSRKRREPQDLCHRDMSARRSTVPTAKTVVAADNPPLRIPRMCLSVVRRLRPHRSTVHKRRADEPTAVGSPAVLPRRESSWVLSQRANSLPILP
jgi:hypothetical protein